MASCNCSFLYYRSAARDHSHSRAAKSAADLIRLLAEGEFITIGR
jgi:hypothetical protein